MSHETVTASLHTRPKILDMLPNNCETLPFPTIFNSPQDRIQFLSHVYSSGDRRRYAELANGTSTPRGVFELPKDIFEEYIAAITDTSPRPELRGKIGLQNLFATTPPDNPSLNAERLKARQVSISGENVRGLAIDPLKIERFGLQQRFIRDQQIVLLGNARAAEDTPLANRLRELGEKRNASDPSADRGDMGLSADIGQAFDEASESLVDRYHTDREPHEGYDGLTEEQKFALRYKEVAKITEDLRKLGSYINPLEYENDAYTTKVVEVVSMNIWGTPKGGAAAPILMQKMVRYLQELALKNPESRPTAKEMERLALTRRNDMALIALQQITDFDTSLPGHFNQALTTSHLFRDEEERLQLQGGFKPRYVGANPYYSGVDLGCPALRERHSSVSATAQAKEAHFISNIFAVTMHEAARRGLLTQQG